MKPSIRLSFALFCAALPLAAVAEALAWVQPDDVRVERLAEGIRIELEMNAPVTQVAAWRVLIDFDNMARFVPNLESSRVVFSQANTLKIEQRGTAHFGPFSQRFESVREITLSPQREVAVRQLSGTARRMESRMRLSPGGDGNTRLEYRAEIVPDMPIPPLFGPSFVRHEIAEQFTAMINEMVRRQNLAKAPTQPVTAPPASPTPPPGSKGS
ncbi:MAG: SRPBCC family protein [Betaproteobacteria bacterium]